MAFMALVLVASVPLCAGRLAGVGELRLRGAWLLIVALLAQIAITEPLAGVSERITVPLHLATYALVALVVWWNRHIRGLLILGAGALSNGVVIALNGGTLPASAGALADAGWHRDPSEFNNSGVLAHPVLPWLGDIVATPSWLPFRNVVSVGDLLILAGAAVLLHVAGRSWIYRLVARESATVGRHRASGRVPAATAS